MATTIAVSDETHAWLSRLKAAAGVRSLDEALGALAEAGLHTAERLMARRKKAVISACRSLGIKGLVAFGSRAWGAPLARSDLDLVAEFDRRVSLFDVLHAQDVLGEAFGVPVDLHLWSTLKPRLHARVEKDGVRLLG